MYVHGQISACTHPHTHAQNQKSWNRYAKNASRNRTKQRSQVPWGEKKKVSPAPFLINYFVYQSLNRVIDDARANKLISKAYDKKFNEIYVDSTLF